MARILAIDDDPDVLAILTLCLASAGHTVHSLEDSSKFERELTEFHPDLVILDIMMPGATGGSLYHAIRALAGPRMPIIISSASNIKIHTQGRDELLAYYRKPADTAQLLEAVQRLIAQALAMPAGRKKPSES